MSEQGGFVNAINDNICVSTSDYRRYGCTRCGHNMWYCTVQGPGYAMGSCSKCRQWISICADGVAVAPFKIGDADVPVVAHPLATKA